MVDVRVLDDRVLVALPPDEERVTESGIVLVKDPDLLRTPTQGVVVQVGEKRGTVDLDDVRAELNELFLSAEWQGPNPIHVDKDDVDRLLLSMAPAPFDVQVGDGVIFSATAGDQIERDGITYVILRESDILGIVEPMQKEAA